MIKLLIIIAIFNIWNKDATQITKKTRVLVPVAIGSPNKAKKEGIYGSLVIDKIKLKQRIYPIGDINNTIDHNIELLYENKSLKQYVIVGHSGMGRLAYFDKLHSLNKESVAYLKINGQNLNFVLKKTKKIVKRQINSLIIDQETAKMLLICCDKIEKDKFLVLEFSLQS